MEDAALLRPEHGSPLVFTVDFITPIVDDPQSYGAIAAANAISDVYAMGGEPQVALAICGFPDDKLPREVVQRIFRGGRDKAAEAGCAIAGGHTVIDAELKYGLCVLGVVDPEQVLMQTQARAGDRLVLTKPIGTGIAAQAIKKQILSGNEIDHAVATMSALNRGAKDAALAVGARAATDVTGFGLLGHLHNLALASKVSARLFAGAVPVFDFVWSLVADCIVPGGTERNLAYVEPHVRWDDSLGEADRLVLADAQTSGGLLIAVPAEREQKLLQELAARGAPARAVVGEIVAGPPGQISVVAGAGR